MLHMNSHLYRVYSGVLFILNLYYACNSKWQAFKLATLSGLAEPLGVIIVGKFALVSLLIHASSVQVPVLSRVSEIDTSSLQCSLSVPEQLES